MLEQDTGLEPVSSAWKAEALPLYQPCLFGLNERNRTDTDLTHNQGLYQLSYVQQTFKLHWRA